MRLWTIHPKYLDTRGLTALWREALLARAVLRGRTKGYRHHPQLARFRAHPSPRSAISTYLAGIHAEAAARGYSFDASKIGRARCIDLIPSTSGQVAHEWQHLLLKLAKRSPGLFRKWRRISAPSCHPIFRIGPGAIEPWERTSSDG
jgi:hypothetical protein